MHTFFWTPFLMSFLILKNKGFKFFDTLLLKIRIFSYQPQCHYHLRNLLKMSLISSIRKMSITSDMQMILPVRQKVKMKESFDESERGEWKSWLKTQHSKNKDHGIRSHHFMVNRWGNNGNSERLYFLRLQNHCRWCLQPWNWKSLAPWKKSYDQPKQHIKKQRDYLADKGPSSQSYNFSSNHVWLWELDYKESWAPKNWCFWTVVLEKTLESPLDFKEIKPDNPKGNQSMNVHWKDWCWSWSSNTLAMWCK